MFTVLIYNNIITYVSLFKFRRLRKNLKEAYEEIKNAGGDASRVLKPTDLDLETLPDHVVEDIKGNFFIM